MNENRKIYEIRLYVRFAEKDQQGKTKNIIRIMHDAKRLVNRVFTHSENQKSLE